VAGPSAEQIIACLDTLPVERLRAVVDKLHIDAADRRARAALAGALASASLGDVLAALKLPELRAFAGVIGVSATGNKDLLVQRLLASGAVPLRAPSTPPGGGIGGSGLKSALRALSLNAAAGLRGDFTRALLACFGWPDGEPPGARMPGSLSVVDQAKHRTREVSAWWPERRVLADVVPADAPLDAAWGDLLRVCLQADPNPQYVVLTNGRELRLYDLSRDRATPRVAFPLDDLAKYSEVFAFLAPDWVPGTTPKFINVEKVSGEVADLVARLYRSLKARFPKREDDVVRFTLQCIITMFAEDIGLLPPQYFTSILYEGARHGDAERRIRDLFALMSTREVPPPRPIAFFNGGLFSTPVTLPLAGAELAALTKAAEANWRYVDPHIFGSVFQGIMDDAERHASGAHYTAHDDIMRVVGPTIVEPWRKRIQAAGSLKELTELRKELFAYRVLDPACGSGNFLYVAFRELYRLDTELLSRMREFPSTAGKLSWNGGISAANFYGIDINPFAVELAKVTLNIAKKIAFEERKAQAFALAGQVEMDIDPSLPLDNLDKNIVCADALFAEWPEVDAIVGNPPILGDKKLRSELGGEYIGRLQRSASVDGLVDLCCYWFRRAHDRLPNLGRAGLVATSGIRVGKAREASLDYIVANGGTLTNAVSSRIWPGEAALNVSMVNWTKGLVDGPFQLVVDDQVFPVARIPTHLQLHADLSRAKALTANQRGTTVGVQFGHEAFRSGESGFVRSAFGAKTFIRPVATGDGLLRGRLNDPDVCVWLTDCATEQDAKALAGGAFEYLKKHVYSLVKERAESETATDHYGRWLLAWWKPIWSREEFFSSVAGKRRLIVCGRVQERAIFEFLSSRFVPTDALQVFGFEDDFSFGILHSGLHWAWTKAAGGKVTERIRYTTDVWRSFPWPQDPTDEQVAAVAQSARELRRVRTELMATNGWSLRTLYQAAEVEGSHPMKDAQAALDAAVGDAYGMPPDQSATEFLLELNQLISEDEEQGRKVCGPGLPDHLDPDDPRWMSTDCIEPPPVEN
jgi:SAM-dependent methyltransferase